jgi:hypothetical protein
MGKTGDRVNKILVWSYERGTLQYDILCALILLFIFAVPRSCFRSKHSLQQQPQASTERATAASPQPEAPNLRK